jgi:hypothetical protein
MKPIVSGNRKSSKGLFFFLCSGTVLAFSLILFSGKEKAPAAEPEMSDRLAPPEIRFNKAPDGKSVSFEILSAVAEDSIVYTLDGSAPGIHSELYTQPVIAGKDRPWPESISGIPTSPRWQPPLSDHSRLVVVKAAVISEGKISAVSTHTFFPGESRSGGALPVFSISTDPANLFDYRQGIFIMGQKYEDKDNYTKKNIPLDQPWWRYPANYAEHGKKSFRPVHLEYFFSGKRAFSADAAMRVSGNATRGYSQKSMTFSFRRKFAAGPLAYRLFSGDTSSFFSGFVLKNAGNDWDKAFMRDAFAERLLKGTAADVPAYQPVVAYINGEYWGIYQMCEKMDEEHLAHKYGLKASAIVIPAYVSADTTGNKFDDAAYMKMLRFIRDNDLSLSRNYEAVKKQMDVKNYMDYVIAEVFMANSDWPHNNMSFWRLKHSAADTLIPQADGRFRWIMNDFDYGYGGAVNADYNMLDNLMKEFIFRKLIRNEEFKQQFLDRFNVLLGTVFRTDLALEQLDKMQAELEPEMQAQISRWRSPASLEKWKEEIAKMRAFAERRPQIQAEQLNSFFGLSGDRKIIIKSAVKAH